MTSNDIKFTYKRARTMFTGARHSKEKLNRFFPSI